MKGTYLFLCTLISLTCYAGKTDSKMLTPEQGAAARMGVGLLPIGAGLWPGYHWLLERHKGNASSLDAAAAAGSIAVGLYMMYRGSSDLMELLSTFPTKDD